MAPSTMQEESVLHFGDSLKNNLGYCRATTFSPIFGKELLHHTTLLGVVKQFEAMGCLQEEKLQDGDQPTPVEIIQKRFYCESLKIKEYVTER
ncbi:hypothetical protein AVEN_172947-1, partial [Araneus ventricosus]